MSSGPLETVRVFPMPLAGKEIDWYTVADILDSVSEATVYVEKVHAMPGQGVTSTFTFGKNFGGLLGAIAALSFPYRLVTPQAWKKVILAGTGKTKDDAIAYARRTYPDVPLILPRCRKPHEGICEALCIMEYGSLYGHRLD